MPVSRADAEAFQADGAVVLRQLLTPDEVGLLRAGIEENLAHPSPRAKVASARDDPGEGGPAKLLKNKNCSIHQGAYEPGGREFDNPASLRAGLDARACAGGPERPARDERAEPASNLSGRANHHIVYSGQGARIKAFVAADS